MYDTDTPLTLAEFKAQDSEEAEEEQTLAQQNTVVASDMQAYFDYLDEYYARPEYDGSGLLCCQNKEVNGEERIDIYLYDVNTGETTVLFEDDAKCSFRPVGQTSDKLIGKVNSDMDLVWLSREEYESGSTDYHEIITTSTFWSEFLS